MKKIKRYINGLSLLMAVAIIASCSEISDEPVASGRGTRAYAEVTLGDYELFTRAGRDPYDGWSSASFSSGDKAGLFATKGAQSPENENDYSGPAFNIEMDYEGSIGIYHRFGSASTQIDPYLINQGYSIMYSPYYPDMPPTITSDAPPGLPLREKDPKDGILKCIDFLHTNSWRIPVENGVLRPNFYHQFFTVGIQRGEGFQNVPDDRIWVVMTKPYTDIRITQKNSSGEYSYTLQYTPPDGEDVMQTIEDLTDFKVNKYAVWETWKGAKDYDYIPTKYVVLPNDEIFFILIQDQYGNWQTVTDFTLNGTTKKGTSGTRYILRIELQGVHVVVRPVSIEKWDEEATITDNRKVGINSVQEYYDWVALYNTYIQAGRSSDYLDGLRNYGDVTIHTDTGEAEWTFYVNINIEWQSKDFPTILRLQDKLEGSSTYTNYVISNVSGSLIDELAPGGCLNALDFRDLYVIQPEEDTKPCGAIANVMNGGTVSNCNIFGGVLLGRGVAGMIAGEYSGGTITDCTVSGDVIGKSSEVDYKGLFGKLNAAPELQNVHYSELKFIKD